MAEHQQAQVEMEAGRLGRQLVAVRKLRDISQQELAAAAAIHAPSLSLIERGLRQTSAAKLGQLLGLAGYRLLAVPTTSETALETSIALRQLVARRNQEEATRLVLRFGKALSKETKTVRALLCDLPPEPVDPVKGDWDRFLAGVVEYELAVDGLPLPAWLKAPADFAVEWSPVGEVLAPALRTATPEALLKRGVLLRRELLE